MPLGDLTQLLAPHRCAIVNMECQENLLGPSSPIPALAQGAIDVDLVANLARLYAAARAIGIRIYYCTDERRADGFGLTDNLPIRAKMVGGLGKNLGGHGPVVTPLTPQPQDVVFRREQGVTGFFATGLDQYLRNTGVQTLIVTGVSLNLAVLGTTIESANLGYTTVVPPDCVAGVPREYVEAVLKYTIRNIAYTISSPDILATWASALTGDENSRRSA